MLMQQGAFATLFHQRIALRLHKLSVLRKHHRNWAITLSHQLRPLLSRECSAHPIRHQQPVVLGSKTRISWSSAPNLSRSFSKLCQPLCNQQTNQSSRKYSRRWLMPFPSPSWSASAQSSPVMNSSLNSLISALSMVLATSYRMVLLEFCSMIRLRLWPPQTSSTLCTLRESETKLKQQEVETLSNKWMSIISSSTQTLSPRKSSFCNISSRTLRATPSSDLCSSTLIRITCQRDLQT